MPIANRLYAEFLGTAWLVLGGCGSAVLAAGFPRLGIGFAGVALAFGLTVLTVLTFRRSLPLSKRPPDVFRAPGYPVVQILFVLIAAAVVASVIGAAPGAAAKGAVLIALGVPVYFWYASAKS